MPNPYRPFLLLLACVVGAFAPFPARADTPRVLTPQADDTAVRGAVRLASGAWEIADTDGDGVLQITEDGTTLDLRGAALIGAGESVPADRYEGVGIRVVGAQDVTIRGGVVRGFKVAIQAVDAPGLTIRGVDASENFRQHLGSTAAREDPSDWLRPHANDDREWETRYGAGLSLTGCNAPVITTCRVHRGQNGLLLTRCAKARVEDNDFSFNSGWGIALYRSTRCIVARNRCDWCVRGYSHGVYHRGQDSAGILVFEQCSDNIFVGNSATHSGDGFFLYAGHATTQKTGTGGCNRNVVYDNDFSHAVANGIEATFSLDNIFVRNDCSGCDHGIWAGYSARSLFAGNLMKDCLSAGVSIEHGQENRIVHNVIQGGGAGIHLWWDHDKAFVDGVFGKARDTSSSQNVLHGNDITGTRVAVKLVRDTGTVLLWNVLHAREALLELGAGTVLGTMRHNLLRGIRSTSREPPVVVRGEGAGGFALDPENQRRGRLRADPALGLEALGESLRLLRPPPRLPDVPEPPGEGRIRLPPTMPRGREQMRVDDWGPLDPTKPAVFPTTVHAGGPRATVDLVGRGSFKVRATAGHVMVTPAQGTLPARVAIDPTSGGTEERSSSLRTFHLEIDVAGRPKHVRGSLLCTVWRVMHFAWTTDPRTDEAAWLAAAAKASAAPAPPSNYVTTIAYAWKTGGPPGLEPDRFGTLATTSLKLPKGRYRLSTVSDDGVRVTLDGVRVIDNWTHHGPTEDSAEVDVEAGEHAVRIEHFEIDGWAHLAFRIERLR